MPSKISAKMHPMDQMSIAVEYFAKKDPHSSGARYLPDNTILSDLVYTPGAERAFARAQSCSLNPESAADMYCVKDNDIDATLQERTIW